MEGFQKYHKNYIHRHLRSANGPTATALKEWLHIMKNKMMSQEHTELYFNNCKMTVGYDYHNENDENESVNSENSKK